MKAAAEYFLEHNENRVVPNWVLDDTLYDIGYVKDGELSIEPSLRRDFTRKARSNHANYLLNRGIIKNFDCFYSGVRCWIPGHTFGQGEVHDSWLLTKDHVIPLRMQKDLEEPLHVFVMSAAIMNYRLGHSPLAIKLWVRYCLSKYAYSRNSRSPETMQTVMQHVFNILNQFKADGRYMYQPWTYPEGHVAYQFYEKICKVENEFSQVGPQEYYKWLSEYDIRWMEELRTQ